MSNLKASGADTLVIIAPPRQGAQAVKFAAESGWKPVTLLSYIASSVAALRPAGLDNAKGLITSQFIKPVDAPAFADDAAVKRYVADHAAAKPRFDKADSQGQVGYVTGEALIRVLELMKQPTRQAMMDVARQMNKVEVDLLLPGITLTTQGAADPYPIESLQLVRFDGAQYTPLGKPVSFEGKTPRHNWDASMSLDRRSLLAALASGVAIARMTSLLRNTVRKWLKAPVAVEPKYRRGARRPSSAD